MCAAVQGQRIYISGYNSSLHNSLQQVYVYDVNTDRWDSLPRPSQYFGIPHIIGGKLCIIGGRLCTTYERTNQVITFDEATNLWVSYYPNLRLARSGPGVITHLEHIIVAGGASGDFSNSSILDDIEVLNWTENLQWAKVSVRLPKKMFNLKMTIFADFLHIVGYYSSVKKLPECGIYKIPINAITISNSKHASWTQVTPSFQWITTPVYMPNSSHPLVVVGGHNDQQTTADIKIYDAISKKWKIGDSLMSARSSPAVAMVGDNAIVVMGGHRDAHKFDSSAISLVEMGQVELRQA